nr:MAG TPA: hypothetical protein [Caudoviricetes sp.]
MLLYNQFKGNNKIKKNKSEGEQRYENNYYSKGKQLQ